ncbi:MAG: hypothetical protein V4507_02720 [Verrucomicrobiota bacterium]
MARTIGITVLTLLIGIFIGGLAVHKHHQGLWRKKFDEKKPLFFERGRGEGMDRLPAELMERLGSDLNLPDAELAQKVEALPFYQRLSLEERSKFMERLNRIRKKQLDMSAHKLEALGLKLDEDQKKAFHKSMMEKHSANMKVVRERSESVIQDLEKKSDQELLQEFGSKTSVP